MSVITRTNLCTNPSVEVATTGWAVGGSAPPTIAQSAVQAFNRTKSLLITWATGGSIPLVQGPTITTAVGVQYTVSCYVYVPSGNPRAALVIPGIGLGGASTLFDQWQRISQTFTATATSHVFQIWPSFSPTSGQIMYVDAVLIEQAPIVASYFDGASSGCVWTGTTDLSTSNQLDGPLSITVVNDLVNEPPRNIIYVTGAPGTTAQVTRTDTNLDGATRPVRGGDPAPVLTGQWVGYDYEMPYNIGATYTVIPSDASPNAFVAVPAVTTTQARIIHPGVPSLSIQINGWHHEAPRGTDTGAAEHVVLGRKFPQIITDGQRKSVKYSATIRTTTELQNAAFRAIADGSVPLLLQVVYPFTTAQQWEYISIGHIDETRLTEQFGDPHRIFRFDITVVDRPAGGIAAQRTWADLLSECGTWQDVLTKYATWTGTLTGVAGT